MIRTRNTRRGGFTLVELLVGISIFLALAGLTLLLYPGARDQDRVRYTVNDIGAHLRMAQSMAARDKAPRGIRFVVNSSISAAAPDPTNPSKTDPLWVTELQYIEQPPPLIPTRTPLTTGNPDAEPRVRFAYAFSAGGTGNPAAGTITGRTCTIENLSSEQIAVIQSGCTLSMPVFGFWSKITTVAPSGSSGVTCTLEVYPDAIMGGSTSQLTYHFAIFLRATPLVGEPTVPLPKNICVDLNVSLPPATGSDFEVLFGPDGKLVGSTRGQLFLWVREFTKPAPYSGPGVFLTGAPLMDALRKGGEQQIIAIRASGAHAFNNIAWPANGSSYGTTEPYQLARDQGR